MTSGNDSRRRLFPFLLFGPAVGTLIALCFIFLHFLTGSRGAGTGTHQAVEEAALDPRDSRAVPPAARIPASASRLNFQASLATQVFGPDPTISREESARRRAEAAVQALEGSGPGRPSSTSNALQAIEGWKATAPFGNLAAFSTIRCFERGCTVTVTQRLSDVVTEDGPTNHESRRPGFWKGAVFRSGNVPAGPDRFQNTWIFYQPPSANN